MSMITGCPACGTLFKVVPDQLKVSEGWVRCGHCGDVFDAAAHLQPEPVPAAAGRPPAAMADTEPAGIASLGAETVPDMLSDAAAEAPAPVPGTAPVRAEPAVASPPPQVPMALPLRHPDPAPAPAATPVAGAPLAEPPAAPSDPAPLSEPFASDSDYVREVEAIRSASADASFAPGGDEHAAALQEVGFVRNARREARWRRPVVRAALALLALLLVGLLAVQVGLQHHDRLAADMPGLRPALQALCEAAGCRLQPPRRIDALVIDGSGFTRLRGDTYRLSVTVRNQALGPAATPHLELTLTDTQDQPVVRRVFSPADLGGDDGSIAAAAEWSGAADVTLALPSASNRVAGYRLLAFYP
jgi:predicted Zn finger-like uncharacterized protein